MLPVFLDDDPELVTQLRARGIRSGYLGVSICSHLFSRVLLAEIVGWAEAQLEEFLILLADRPQRHTFTTFRGMSEAEAEARVLRIAEEKRQLIQRVLRRAEARRSRCIDWGDLEGTPGFAGLRDALWALYGDSGAFRIDVQRQVDRRAGEDATRRPEDLSADERDRAAAYVVEELTAMLYLQELHAPAGGLQIYPMAPPRALEGLYGARYPELREPLAGLLRRPKGLYCRFRLPAEVAA